MVHSNDYSLDSERENAVPILPQKDYIKVRFFRWNLSQFSVTTANLHKADLIFVISTLFIKCWMLR